MEFYVGRRADALAYQVGGHLLYIYAPRIYIYIRCNRVLEQVNRISEL